MSSFFMIFLIGISLSMDAFSLAIIYGIKGISPKQKLLLSIIVGLYHFFMPLIGYEFGNIINSLRFINIDLIASLILIYIGIDFFFSKNENELSLNTLGLILFGLSVSIDSLTVGIGLKALTNNNYLAAITFSLLSFIFTYTGLHLGNIIGNKIGSYSKKIGGLILIIIAIILFIT